MAGRPIRRMMIAELERLAAEQGEGVTAVDYVCEYIAEGADADGTPHTLAELARKLTDTAGQTISAGILTSWLNSTSESKAKVAAARALAAHVHAEASLAVLDELDGTEVTREEVALAKARAETRQWLASKWNRPTYGGEAQVQINNTQISAADSHLAALAQRKQIKATTQLPLPAPEGADYEVIPNE